MTENNMLTSLDARGKYQLRNYNMSKAHGGKLYSGTPPIPTVPSGV